MTSVASTLFETFLIYQEWFFPKDEPWEYDPATDTPPSSVVKSRRASGAHQSGVQTLGSAGLAPSRLPSTLDEENGEDGEMDPMVVAAAAAISSLTIPADDAAAHPPSPKQAKKPVPPPVAPKSPKLAKKVPPPVASKTSGKAGAAAE
jgi:hypothetical protein